MLGVLVSSCILHLLETRGSTYNLLRTIAHWGVRLLFIHKFIIVLTSLWWVTTSSTGNSKQEEISYEPHSAWVLSFKKWFSGLLISNKSRPLQRLVICRFVEWRLLHLTVLGGERRSLHKQEAAWKTYLSAINDVEQWGEFTCTSSIADVSICYEHPLYCGCRTKQQTINYFNVLEGAINWWATIV